MPRPARPTVATRPPATLAPASRHWLLLVHQLPPTPSNLRVRTWRRLQQLGALAVKQSVYVLPDTPASREDFEWLKTEIEGAGGQAVVFAADSVDAWADDGLVEEFRAARQTMYAELAKEIERATRVKAHAKARARATRRPPVDVFRERFAAIERIDFFGSAGRDRVVTLLDQLAQAGTTARPATDRSARRGGREGHDYRGRTWVTRPRPGVDRMACAWLIRRLIDPAATFAFAPDAAKLPDSAVPFDMFGVTFTHRGAQCTFEMLVETFGLETPAIARIAALVHDLDLKDERFGAPEAAVVGSLIEGLQFGHTDDHVLLEHGVALFEGLHQSFTRSARLAGPRAVSPRGTRKRR